MFKCGQCVDCAFCKVGLKDEYGDIFEEYNACKNFKAKTELHIKGGKDNDNHE